MIMENNRFDGRANLIPVTERTKEEARELSIKGGKASGEVRKRQRTMREAFKLYLSCKLPKDSPLYQQAVSRMAGFGIEGDPTVQDLINLGMITKAAKGDVHAAEFVRDTSGEKPAETFEDITPKSPIILGTIPVEMVAKAKAEHDARQLENNKQ